MYQLPIRPFDKSTDFERVKNFFAQMGGETRGFFNQGGGNERFALGFFDESPPEKYGNSALFMALDDDKMAGYVFLRDLDKGVLWLGIAVAEDWKGRHLGRDLMRHAETYARERGKGGIMLTTSQANIRGQSLYRRCGYEYIGVHMGGELLFLRNFGDI